MTDYNGSSIHPNEYQPHQGLQSRSNDRKKKPRFWNKTKDKDHTLERQSSWGSDFAFRDSRSIGQRTKDEVKSMAKSAAKAVFFPAAGLVLWAGGGKYLRDM
jgi:hypothetical protein